MPLDEVGQELVRGKGGRRRVDGASLCASFGDQRVQLVAVCVGESEGRAFGSEPGFPLVP